MKTKKFLQYVATVSLSSLSSLLSIGVLTGCGDSDNLPPQPPIEPPTGWTIESGMYILNSGNMNSNNSTLDLYNPGTAIPFISKFFNIQNGRGLGDTANDMIVYGSKMYFAVNVSNTIEVTNRYAKSDKTITPILEGESMKPRCFAAYEGKIYVSLFSGHVAEIDTTSLEITRTVEVGPNPEQIAVSGGKLYVAISGGLQPTFGNTIAEIDPETFTVTNEIEVRINPSAIKAGNDGMLYVVSIGDYFGIDAALQRVDPITKGVTVIDEGTCVFFNINDDKIYLITSDRDNSTGLPINPVFKRYDINRKAFDEGAFIDSETFTNPSSISINPKTGNVYISSSDYMTTGDVYEYSPAGTLLNVIEVSGLNPMGVYFID